MENPPLFLRRIARAWHILFPRSQRRILEDIEAWLSLQPPDEETRRAVVRWARTQLPVGDCISIDRHETMCRARPQGLEIRAWYLVPHNIVAAISSPDPTVDEAAMALPALTRAILILSVRHGMSIDEMSLAFGLSRSALRKHLRRAVNMVARRGNASGNSSSR